jgi:hypothetical protein
MAFIQTEIPDTTICKDDEPIATLTDDVEPQLDGYPFPDVESLSDVPTSTLPPGLRICPPSPDAPIQRTNEQCSCVDALFYRQHIAFPKGEGVCFETANLSSMISFSDIYAFVFIFSTLHPTLSN